MRPPSPALVMTALLLLSGLSADAFVGDAMLLTQRAETLSMEGRHDAARRARERAKRYAEETLAQLAKSRAPADPRVVRLFESIIEECDFWLADEDTAAERLREARRDMDWLRSHLADAAQAESAWREAARRGDHHDADEALELAVALRREMVSEFESRLEHTGGSTQVFYLEHALVRLRWALAELEAEAAQWRSQVARPRRKE